MSRAPYYGVRGYRASNSIGFDAMNLCGVLKSRTVQPLPGSSVHFLSSSILRASFIQSFQICCTIKSLIAVIFPSLRVSLCKRKARISSIYSSLLWEVCPCEIQYKISPRVYPRLNEPHTSLTSHISIEKTPELLHRRHTAHLSEQEKDYSW